MGEAVLDLSDSLQLWCVRCDRHVDLYYEDGGNPTEEILQSFLQICETERGAIAVHCKAGLGRTGTNIAAYMMKHFGYTAKETMAWCRYERVLELYDHNGTLYAITMAYAGSVTQML